MMNHAIDYHHVPSQVMFMNSAIDDGYQHVPAQGSQGMIYSDGEAMLLPHWLQRTECNGGPGRAPEATKDLKLFLVTSDFHCPRSEFIFRCRLRFLALLAPLGRWTLPAGRLMA